MEEGDEREEADDGIMDERDKFKGRKKDRSCGGGRNIKNKGG